MQKFSIIIPIYNEADSIKQTITELDDFLRIKYQKDDYEIILVNDGSTDGTREILENLKADEIKLVSHTHNRGYGASLKTGVKNARHGIILFFDGDGQHKSEYIPELLKYVDEYDMVVGRRQKYQGPSWRQPGKKLMGFVANYLMGQRIPDLNSGMRAFKKNQFLNFIHLLPNQFSLSTTLTLAFLNNGLTIKYVPIIINSRTGKSKVKIKDGFNALLLILRMIMLFNPMKVFAPISAFLFFFGLIFSIYGIIIYGRFPISGVLIILSGIILFFNGLLADQLAAIRKNPEK